MSETTRSRIRKVLAGEMPDDRLPMIEWASWWDKTISRWNTEGMPETEKTAIKRYFHLDIDVQSWFQMILPDAPAREAEYGGGLISNMQDYEKLLPYLYPRPLHYERDFWLQRADEQARGETVLWLTLNGFFWWPRVLLGIERHLLAFYDQPELIACICRDLSDYQLYCLETFCTEVTVPDFITIAEDMSYNHGPMLSKSLFDDFLASGYRRLTARLRELGIPVIVDSDGDVEPLIPWLEEVGVQGILPLERMAGVDINRIRAKHPDWRMVGGFDKTVMHLGEAAMRAEFERLLPAMRSGYYIPSVDHQTPPAVSLTDYWLYLHLFEEYAYRAVGG